MYTVGYFLREVTADFGNSIVVTGKISSSNPIIAKITSNGTTQWVRIPDMITEAVYFNSIKVMDDSICIAGQIHGSSPIKFFSQEYLKAPFDGINCLLLKTNLYGAAEWCRTITYASGNTMFTDVTMLGEEIYVSGVIRGYSSISFGNGVTAEGITEFNPVLVKYDKYGIAQWAKTVKMSPLGSAQFSDIIVEKNEIYVAGYISSKETYDLGNSIRVEGVAIGKNILVAQYVK